MTLEKQNIRTAITTVILILVTKTILAIPQWKDSLPRSTGKQALAYIQSFKSLDSSAHWPNIDPALLLKNLNATITGPVKSFEGKNTNFCSYTALSYISLKHDPLGFAKFVIELYQHGKAQMGSEMINPSKGVKYGAGLLRYKGEMDINHLAQMWFLSLADHFKGYLNIFDHRFDEGDENRLWAVANFAKFNRMVRRLYGYEVRARGSDLVRPRIGDIYSYLQERLDKGIVFLYLNNRLLYRKNHEVSRFGIPTHYVALTNIYKEGNTITIVYWDAGRKTLQQLTPDFLSQILFGVTFCPNPSNVEN